MSLSLGSLSRVRTRQCVALVLVGALLFAGIAQASHFHKDELARGGVDTHCLLCAYGGGNAAPPVIAQLAQAVAPWSCQYRFPYSTSRAPNNQSASYDARGPPVV